MATIQELQQQQARIAENARAKFDEITDDTPEARAGEIEREFDAMMADHARLGEMIARQQQLEAAEAAIGDPDPRRPDQRGSAPATDRGAEPPSYRAAFHAYVRAQGNIGAMRPDERAVLEHGYSSLPGEARAQTTTQAEGGYSIPQEMLKIIVETMQYEGPMYEGGPTTTFGTSGGNPMPFPTIDDTAGTATAHTEGTTLTDDGSSDVTFGQGQLDAYAYDTKWLRVSRELASDSFLNMETLLGSLLGKRMGRVGNAKLTIGTGTGEPNGIVTASTAGKTAASATAIIYDEILDLTYNVNRAYRVGRSVGYMFNDATLLALLKLKDGDGNYLVKQGNVVTGAPGTLNGFPYWINPDMPDIATGTKPVLFGDFSHYFVRKVGDPLIGVVQGKEFWPGFGMAGYFRFDGELSDTAAVKHLVMA